jgi:hypothetical protein
MVAWLAAGCTFMSTSGMTTEGILGGPDGDVTIECRTDGSMDGNACLAWGERVRDALPTDAADAVRIVLTDRQGVGGCLADFQDADGVLYASAAVDCP